MNRILLALIAATCCVTPARSAPGALDQAMREAANAGGSEAAPAVPAVPAAAEVPTGRQAQKPGTLRIGVSDAWGVDGIGSERPNGASILYHFQRGVDRGGIFYRSKAAMIDIQMDRYELTKQTDGCPAGSNLLVLTASEGIEVSPGEICVSEAELKEPREAQVVVAMPVRRDGVFYQTTGTARFGFTLVFSSGN